MKYGWRESEYMLDLYDKYSNVSKNLTYENKAHDFVVINLGTNDASFLNKYVGQDNSYAFNYALLLKKVVEDNPNATIICIYGMMGLNKTIKSDIETAVEDVKSSTGLSTIYTLFDFTAVSGRHPIESEHEVFAKTLFNFIKSLNK